MPFTAPSAAAVEESATLMGRGGGNGLDDLMLGFLGFKKLLTG